MNLEEFLTKLEETKDEYSWVIHPAGGIRTKDGFCPLAAVAKIVIPSWRKSGYAAGDALGIPFVDVTNIVVAADWDINFDPAVKDIRERMMTILFEEVQCNNCGSGYVTSKRERKFPFLCNQCSRMKFGLI